MKRRFQEPPPAVRTPEQERAKRDRERAAMAEYRRVVEAETDDDDLLLLAT